MIITTEHEFECDWLTLSICPIIRSASKSVILDYLFFSVWGCQGEMWIIQREI